MKTSYKSIFVVLLFTTLALSCSRKKDKFISRNYHAVTAEFNALFNGYNSLEEGRQSLNEAYFDNYWEVLPIERMQVSDEFVLPGQSKNENFTRAEEKAAKAIQKHSMNIDGKEKNPQMDEAYLLLGKARYFDQRFVPALEAFNYILYKYPASDKINQAKVWREKANIRLDNNKLAIENLKRLLKQEELEGQDLADASSILAQAYLNVKVIDTAITLLETASQATKRNEERGRYRFIQGQLYNELGHKDSANIAFDRVIDLNRKIPRIYMISAYLEKVKNFDFENGNKLELTELLTELEENRENRPFLDRIYYQIAEYHLKNGSDSLAVDYYNKSLRTDSQDNILVAKNYETLGDMNFDASIYAKAGKYYDSTMGSLVENSKPYRIIRRKRDNLEDVIHYETVAKVDDSILKLVNMSEAERLSYFEGVVEDLKAKAEEEKKAQEAAEHNSGLVTTNNQFGGPRIGPPGNKQQANTFYFYNSTTVAYGKNEFVKVWGDRKLEDNWRWSSKAISSSGNASALSGDVLASASEDERFDPQFYMSKIPSEEKEIDSISRERNYAYYQLGLIYKEKFKEYELAKTKLQDLLNSNPEERLVLPSKYNLFKLYEALGESDEAAIAKQNIISEYPKSRYALILTNPELVSEKDENSPRSLYEALYEQHLSQEYAEVISKSEDYINKFDGEPIVPKFVLLKATATGRLHGYEAYKKAINNLAVTYANTPEGKEAQEIESKILPNLASTDFVTNDSISGNYKVIFKFENVENEQVSAFKKTLDEVLENIRYYKLKSSIDVYDPNTKLVLVHGLKTEQVAITFDQLLTKDDRKKIKAPYFVVSSANYQIIQIHKNLDAYLNIFNN
ncbi:tetratricopeptide repeat protein [Flavobacteriaceae bacterium GSB9]|nr:tetratricopeptide repeat protein [Flavobacteriaceae bacterium GSB9]